MSEREEMDAKPTPIDVLNAFGLALKTLKAAKPEDHTQTDRRFAVTITDLEKVMAYFATYVIASISMEAQQ